MDTVDICIVGSGFGGAIAAARLSEQCKARGIRATIRVLERGHDFFDFDPKTVWKYRNAQGNGFKQTTHPDYYSRLFNVTTDLEGAAMGGGPTATMMGGSGIGGSSLVYYAVKLRAPTATFEQKDDGGRRLWPTRFTKAALAPHYERVEKALRVTRMSWSSAGGVPKWQLCTKRDHVFAQGCLKIGATAEPLKIALQNDTSEGWWSTGQRFPGRQHLPLNYLRTAKQNGVAFAADCDVQSIAPDGRGYAVTYYDARTKETQTLSCKMLILSAGAVGSTGILLKSRKAFRGARALSEKLGLHVSGNGDYGISGIVGRSYEVEGHKGKPMSSVCPSFWKEHKFLVIPLFLPPMPMAVGQPVHLAYPKNPAAVGRRSTEPGTPLWGKEYKEMLSTFGSRVLSMGVIGFDKCEGVISTMRTPAGEKTVVKWPTTHPETEARWNTAFKTMRKIYNALGGEALTDQYRHRGHVITVHPLGGCRMAPGKGQGVVSDIGEVFDNRNLFVLDGGIIPAALGVNPSLTISAVAEYVCEAVAESLAERLAA